MKSKYKKVHSLPNNIDFSQQKHTTGAKKGRNKISLTSLFILNGRKNVNLVDKRGEIKVLKSIVPKNGLRGLL